MIATLILVLLAVVGFIAREQYQRRRYRQMLRQVRTWLDEHGQEWDTSEQVAFILRDLDGQGRD